MSKKKRPKKKAKTEELSEYDVFGEFGFIAGYTEGGMPYGMLAEDMVDKSEEESKKDVRKKRYMEINDEDLPF